MPNRVMHCTSILPRSKVANPIGAIGSTVFASPAISGHTLGSRERNMQSAAIAEKDSTRLETLMYQHRRGGTQR